MKKATTLRDTTMRFRLFPNRMGVYGRACALVYSIDPVRPTLRIEKRQHFKQCIHVVGFGRLFVHRGTRDRRTHVGCGVLVLCGQLAHLQQE